LKYQEQRILLSNLINKDSKILFERNPLDRVAKVAPWLTLDGDPYPALVDGKIMWIIDGFTTSAGYPYSRQSVLSNVLQIFQALQLSVLSEIELLITSVTQSRLQLMLTTVL